MSERSGDRDRCLGDVDDRYLELLTQALAAGLTEAGHDDGVEMLCLGGRQVEHARGADVAVVPTLRRTHSPARRADHDFGAGPGRPPGLRADDGGRGIAVGDEQPHRARPSDATASGATRLPDQARPALRHRELMLQILGGESHDATVATGRYSEMTRL